MTYALHMLFLFLKQALRQEFILNCWYLVYFEFEAISHYDNCSYLTMVHRKM